MTGFRDRIRHIVYRFSERFHERRFGIATAVDISIDQFGVTDPNCHRYNATNYRRFKQIMKWLKIRPDQDVFVDFGSGMGRVVVLAATYPFRKVIGVELTAELHEIAEENIRNARRRLRCKDIELNQMDAREYVVPPEVTVIFCWNPFGKEVLEKVFENVWKSVQESPREVVLLYTYPPWITHLDEALGKFEWLKERKRVALGRHLCLTICSFGTLRDEGGVGALLA